MMSRKKRHAKMENNRVKQVWKIVMSMEYTRTLGDQPETLRSGPGPISNNLTANTTGKSFPLSGPDLAFICWFQAT